MAAASSPASCASPMPARSVVVVHEGDHSRAAATKTREQAANRTRVTVLAMVIITELIVQVLSAAMVPFFPDYAEKHLHADGTIVGVIFALYPLSLFLTSLVAGMASARFGRVLVYVIGLVLLGGGTVGFGFCDSLATIMAMRVVQGVGGGCINVAGMALLLQVSNNIERDVGLDQAAIGLGYILGPPLGALLYAYLGFRNLNLVLGAIPLAELLAFPFLAPCIPSASKGASASESGCPTPQCTPAAAGLRWEERREGMMLQQMEGEQSARSVGSLAAGVLDATPASRHPVASFYAMTTYPVVVVALTTVVAFTSLGLFDPLVFPHLQRALGASVQTVGGTFMIPCVVFTTVSLLAEDFMKRLGHKASIAAGLVLMILGFLALGPAPFLLGLPWTRAWAWVDQVLGFVLFGIGFAFVVVAVVPLMHSYLRGFRGAGKEKDDFISAVNSAASSFGEFAGPILGGVMYEKLPRRPEISCKVGGDVEDCSSGAAWTCFAFALVLVPVVVAFLFLAPKPTPGAEEEEGKGGGAAAGGNGKDKGDKITNASTIAAVASPRDVERGPASPMGEVVKSPVRRVQPLRRVGSGQSP